MANKDKARYHRKFTDMEARNSRDALRRTARETEAATRYLQWILRGHTDLGRSRKYDHDIILRRRLDPPAFFGHGTSIRVHNMDTLDAAVILRRQAMQQADPRRPRNPLPAVLNFANARQPGGGWWNGAVAQEEAMCYRSTLAYSLHRRAYPLRPLQGIYSSRVAVLRHSMRSRHAWITDIGSLSPATVRQRLPWYSALTVAAIYKPRTRYERIGWLRRQTKVFAHNADRQLTKDKMRLALHMAAVHGHDMLVLGAFGCGVYENPPWDVAQCWLEVLREYGPRWRCVWFAVYDPQGQGNFRAFKEVLDGRRV
ncbi:mitochondrial chaperone BCS1 [Metarhizium brunneum]